MSALRFRTAARLTSKPLTAFEKEMAGRSAGRRDAFDGKSPRRFQFPRDDDFAEGYNTAYASLVCNGMVGR